MQNKLSEQIPENFLYLFIADLVQLMNKTFSEYQAKEPKYAEPFFKAYLAAFNGSPEEVYNEKFVKQIHQISSTHFKSHISQEYRKAEASFYISNEIYLKANRSEINGTKYDKITNYKYNATAKGLENFINRWLYKPNGGNNVIHQIIIESAYEDPEPEKYLIAENPNDKKLYCGNKINGKWHMGKFSSVKNLLSILNLFENYDYIFRIIMLPAETDNGFEKRLQEILKLGKIKIEEASDEHAKVTAFADLVQQINQLHPFSDANIRTCYVLLNKLLFDHHMKLCIFSNPNRLDCCDLEEIVSSIYEGQEVFKQWLDNKNPEKFIAKLNKNLEINLYSNFLNFEAAKEFYKIIVDRYKPQVKNSSKGIFTQKQEPVEQKLQENSVSYYKL